MPSACMPWRATGRERPPPWRQLLQSTAMQFLGFAAMQMILQPTVAFARNIKAILHCIDMLSMIPNLPFQNIIKQSLDEQNGAISENKSNSISARFLFRANVLGGNGDTE